MARPRKNQDISTKSFFEKMRLDVKLSQEQLAKEIGVPKGIPQAYICINSSTLGERANRADDDSSSNERIL